MQAGLMVAKWAELGFEGNTNRKVIILLLRIIFVPLWNDKCCALSSRNNTCMTFEYPYIIITYLLLIPSNSIIILTVCLVLQVKGD